VIHRLSSRLQRLDHVFLREKLKDARRYRRIAGYFRSSTWLPGKGMFMRIVRCKKYHESRGRTDPGHLDQEGCRKSRCPSWASDPTLRQRLMDEALVDPGGTQDSLGRPKVLWNAVAGWVFVGVSTNEAEEAYNCYPEVPATKLHGELAKRAERTLEQYLGVGDPS
jgi:hypothetical protein